MTIRKPAHLLLVDDDPTVIGVLGTILQEFGRLRFATSGQDALRMARQYWKVVGQADRTKFISLKQGYHGTHFGGAPLVRRDFRWSFFFTAHVNRLWGRDIPVNLLTNFAVDN